MNKIEVIALNSRFKNRENKIKILARKALKILKRDRIFLAIFLISSGRMRTLNKKFRGKDKTADVLSFKEPVNFPHPESRYRHPGEIYLNLDYIKKNAPNFNDNSANRESGVPNILVHGLLHLLDYNHNKKDDRMRMEKKEKLVIGKLGN